MNAICMLTATLAAASALHAGPRTSAGYNVPADTADAGGKRSTSASYTHDGSAGGITGISTAASPAEVAKAGFLGQIFEVNGLTLTAATLTVNEGSTGQLSAWQTLDDLSLLAVPAPSVSWSAPAGPLSINASGLATAGAVYQNTAATAQGGYAGNTGTLALTVVNSLTDNLATYAADGIDDAWQVQYFGLPPNANAAPLLDPDSDGFNNRFEYTAGLTPTDPLSVFRWRIEAVPGQPAQRKIIFSPRLPGRTYTVMTSPGLLNATWISLTGSAFTDSGPERTVTDSNATSARKFYRVEVSKP